MRKLYFLSFLALFIVNSALCTPLTGTYTIGGTTPDYATFNLAVTALLSNGVSGPVIFNARAGTYTEQITITAVTGASSSNTVTFQSETGNAADVTLTFAATGTGNNWVVNLSACSYIIFNKMTLQSTGANFSDVAIMTSNATYDKLTNLIITGPVVTANNNTQILVNLCGDGTLTGYCGVYGCTINNGCYGVFNNFSYYNSSSYNYGMIVENNSLVNQYAGGIYENRCLQGAPIEFNAITSNSTDTAYMGIYVNIQEDTVCCNRITNCPGTGIYFGNCSPFVFNNFVETTGTYANYGIEFDWDNYCGDYIFMCSNSVLVLNTNSQSSAFYMPWPGYAWNFPFNSLSDNVFVNRGGGYAISVVDTGSLTYPNPYSTAVNMDYNDYYTTGTYLGIWGTTNCTTLAAWQSHVNYCQCGGDAHSKNINPSFVSNTNLDLTTDDLRYGKEAPFQAAWPTDINGSQRSTTTPDMGAYEFAGVSNIVQFSANQTSVCPGSSVTFTDQTNNSPTAWKWTFTGGTPDTSTSENPSITYNTSGNYNVQLIVTNGVGTDTLLKSAYITVEPAAVAGSIQATPDTVCTGGSVQISATGSTGSLQWQSSSTNGNFQNIGGATGASYSAPSVTASLYFRVVATNGSCTDTSSSMLVSVVPMLVIGNIVLRYDSCPPGQVWVKVSGSSGVLQLQQSANDTIFSNVGGSLNNNDSVYFETPNSVYYRIVASNAVCSDTSGSELLFIYPRPATPVLSANDTLICASDSALITINNVYSSYSWNTHDTGSSIYVSSAGGYSVTVADANGCPAVSNQIDISVYPVPSVSLEVNGDTLSSLNAVAYQWYKGDTAISGATNPFYIVQQTGYYSVQITDTNGCKTQSTQQYILVTGVEDLGVDAGFSVYPNPFSSNLYIQRTNEATQWSSIEIYDVLGQRVVNEPVSKPASNIIELNVSELLAGLYYVKVTAGDGEQVWKVVKQ